MSKKSLFFQKKNSKVYPSDKISKEADKIVEKKDDNAVEKYVYKTIPPCHQITEIYPGLFIGAKRDALDMANLCKVDILIPLDSIGGNVWDKGWRGEIKYIPITDYDVLPDDLAIGSAVWCIDQLHLGKKIGIFCVGGHGRTGYFVSLILGLLGEEDPIGLLRNKYCEKAVESNTQVKELSILLNHPEWVDKYGIEFKSRYFDWLSDPYYDEYYRGFEAYKFPNLNKEEKKE
jgi:hypothetical protein